MAPFSQVMEPPQIPGRFKHQFVAMLHRLKMSMLNRELAKEVKTALTDATATAFKRLSQMTLHEFMYVVTQSSQDEGVSEADTLLRLIAIEQREALLKRFHTSNSLREILTEIRRTPVKVRTSEIDSNADVKKLRAREVYWLKESLNSLRQPLAAGDVFRTPTSPPRFFVMIGNECDLMLRKDGNRNSTLAILVELIVRAKDSDGVLMNLEAPLPPTTTFDTLRMNRFFGMPMEILDLCWLNNKGKCIWQRKGVSSDLLLQSQIQRLKNLRRTFNAEKELQRVISACPKEVGRVSNTKDHIDFKIQRVGRLNAAYSQGVISRFAAVLARPSYEHDFAREKS